MCFVQALRDVICPTTEHMGFHKRMLEIAFERADDECSAEGRVEVISKWDETDVRTVLTYRLKLMFLGYYEATRILLLGDASFDRYQKHSSDPMVEQSLMNNVLAPLLDFVHPPKKENTRRGEIGALNLVDQFPCVVEFLNGKVDVIHLKIGVLEKEHKAKEEQFNRTIATSKTQKPRAQQFIVLGNLHTSIYSAKESIKKIDMIKWQLARIIEWSKTNPNKAILIHEVRETSELAIQVTCDCSGHWRLAAEKILPIILESSLHGFALCIGRFAVRANSTLGFVRDKIKEVGRKLYTIKIGPVVMRLLLSSTPKMNHMVL